MHVTVSPRSPSDSADITGESPEPPRDQAQRRRAEKTTARPPGLVAGDGE